MEPGGSQLASSPGVSSLISVLREELWIGGQGLCGLFDRDVRFRDWLSEDPRDCKFGSKGSMFKEPMAGGSWLLNLLEKRHEGLYQRIQQELKHHLPTRFVILVLRRSLPRDEGQLPYYCQFFSLSTRCHLLGTLFCGLALKRDCKTGLRLARNTPFRYR